MKPLCITTNVTKQLITIAHKFNTTFTKLLSMQKNLSVNPFNINKTIPYFGIEPVNGGNNTLKHQPFLEFAINRVIYFVVRSRCCLNKVF